MIRPDYLPQYANPPLDEVVIGLQFESIAEYSAINAGEIWKIFSAEFPKVQERPLLEPNFETFGGAIPQNSIRFQVGAPSTGSRLWFISQEEDHLIQYQSDRFLANWRKRPRSHEYPRFDNIFGNFTESLEKFERYVNKKFDQALNFNQGEISYINLIEVDEFTDGKKWFSIWKGGEFDIESLSINFNEIIKSNDGEPEARFIHEIQPIMSVDRKKKAYRLSLTVRGQPIHNDKESMLNFILRGRENIVLRFDEITTEFAHEKWEKLP